MFYQWVCVELFRVLYRKGKSKSFNTLLLASYKDFHNSSTKEEFTLWKATAKVAKKVELPIIISLLKPFLL